MKGHTGAMMSLGKGAVLSYSWKHKINVKSSTESELVGADQSLAHVLVLWCLYFIFIEAQGYSVENNIMFQATMRLETNGQFSSTKRTKHIKARYFFTKDIIDEGEVEVQYCPTEEMWADVLNKPKQGQAFCNYRAMLMNVSVDYSDAEERRRTHPKLLEHEATETKTVSWADVVRT